MKAAHVTTPVTTPVTSPHGNGGPRGSVRKGTKHQSRSHKMVMPPFLRLDSTGEVTSCDPVRPVSQSRTHAVRQTGSSNGTNGFLGSLMSNFTPTCSSRQLTMAQVQSGISALDELYKKRQAMESPVKAGIRPPAKMARPHHPWPDRYGQWGINTYQHCAVLPPGVFPCHVFNASRSQSSLWPLSSGQFAHNTAWSSGQTLVDKVKQSLPKDSHHFNPAHKNQHAATPFAGAAADAARCRVPRATSPCTVKKPSAATSAVSSSEDREKMHGSTPDVAMAASVIETGTRETLAVPSSSDNQTGSHQPSVSLSSDSSSIGEDVQNKISHIQSSRKSTSDCDQSVHKSVSSVSIPIDIVARDSSAAEACSTSTNSATREKPVENGACDIKSVDAKRGHEGANGLCLKMLSGQNGSSVGVQKSADCGGSRFFVAAFQVQPSLEEVDWDETDDECEDTDQEYLAETMGLFMELTLSSLLSSPCRQVQQEKEGKQDGKTPPKPCPAVTRRWNRHYPADPPEHRPSKVQFTCGAEIDRVHLYERAEGEALTVMEIQKERDLSKQNKGKAAKLLRDKNFDEQSELDIYEEAVELTSNVETDCGDVCDGRIDSPDNNDSAASSFQKEKIKAAPEAGVRKVDLSKDRDGGKCAMVIQSQHDKENGSVISMDFDGKDFDYHVFQGDSVSSDCSEDEDDTESESDEDDDDKSDDDDDIVFE